MEFIDTIFGDGTELNAFQMSCRGVLTFLLALIFLRISGRRSFGMRTPLDNIIVILLGAILSRGVVGASPYIPVVTCCLLIAVMHRLLAWATTRSPALAKILQGRQLVLYEQGAPITNNMERALVCEEELEHAIRNKAQTESFDDVDKLYMEHNGEISVIKKK